MKKPKTGRPKLAPDKRRVAICIALTPDLAAKVRAEATRQDRPVSWIVRQALQGYLFE